MHAAQEQSTSHRDKKVKRVKSHSESSNAATMVNTDCFADEEAEGLATSSEDDYALFQQTCEAFRDLFKRVYTAKEENRKPEEFTALRAEACPLFLTLKKLNRLDKHRCKKTRDEVAERKQKVDSFHLQLQNLLYEVMHLQKEVTKCLEFRSKDEEIELVPVEEFYKEAPPSISRIETTKTDVHQLTLSRLEWELEQRKRFAEQLKEAEQTTEKYQVIIRKRKECLDNIQPTLAAILEATEPLQSKLGMPLQATQSQHKPALLLPRPLYVLYVQACSYKEACDKKIHISVEGNVDDAKVLNFKVDDVDEDSGESDQEENSNVKRHRHLASDKRDDSSRNVLNKHPLSVSLTVEGGVGKICIEFFYLYHLKIVTVSVKSLSPHPTSGVYAGDLLKLDNFLDCLFPGDYGKKSPNPANEYHLKKYEESPFTNTGTGIPFTWAQRLGGLEFLPYDLENNGSKQASKVSASMERTVEAIRSRFLSRIHLYNQLLTLEHNTTKLASKLAAMFPVKVNSQLKKWGRVSWDDVLSYPASAEMLELGVISDDAVVFKARIEKGSASLSALVLLFPDYPVKPPVFLLSLQWNTIRTAATSDAVKQLEEEINVHCVEMIPEDCKYHVLMCQVHHLLVCFEIFLETEASAYSFEGPREFPREKVVTRTSRGLNHSRPYKYIPTQGIFTQR